MDWLMLMKEKNLVNKIVDMNLVTQKYQLALSQEEVQFLVERRRESLKKEQRVEFGEGILPKLIFTFCDSPFIDQDTYADTLAVLQDIFYFYKNELMDECTDEELLEVMKRAFDGKCQGSLEYLEETVLEGFARKVREGLEE